MVNDNQYRRSYLLRHRAYEKQATAIIRKALKDQIKDVRAYIKENGYDLLPVAVVTLIKDQPVQKAFARIYQNAGTAEARFEYTLVNKLAESRKKGFIRGIETKGIGISFFSPIWRNKMVDYMLLHAGSRIRGIVDYSRRLVLDKLRFVLAEAQDQNLTIEKTVKLLLKEFSSDEFLQLTENRARAIARTETTTAANYGHDLASESLSITTKDRWVSTRDNRTRRTPPDRFDHWVMNGVEINTGEKFNVSGEMLKFPGDPAGSKGNVINCRCVKRLVPVYDENGLPVSKPVSRVFAVA